MIFQRSFNRPLFTSSARLLALVVLISTVLLFGSTSAQFTQTYGWGGAGMGGYGAGKRSYDMTGGATTSLRQPQCLPNRRLQNYITELIQGELARIRNCRDIKDLRKEIDDYPSGFNDMMP